jgi:hypothetical protein
VQLCVAEILWKVVEYKRDTIHAGQSLSYECTELCMYVIIKAKPHINPFLFLFVVQCTFFPPLYENVQF